MDAFTLPQINEENPNDVNMYPVRLGDPRISTDYAQKSPQALYKTFQTLCRLDDYVWLLFFEIGESVSKFDSRSNTSRNQTGFGCQHLRGQPLKR